MFPLIKEELTQNILPYWINNVELDGVSLLGRTNIAATQKASNTELEHDIIKQNNL